MKQHGGGGAIMSPRVGMLMTIGLVVAGFILWHSTTSQEVLAVVPPVGEGSASSAVAVVSTPRDVRPTTEEITAASVAAAEMESSTLAAFQQSLAEWTASPARRVPFVERSSGSGTAAVSKVSSGSSSGAVTSQHLLRVHIHVISIGDSLVSGFLGNRPTLENVTSQSHPFTPIVAERLKMQLEALSVAESLPLSVTSSYEYHGFPATITKKILNAMRQRFALGGDCKVRSSATVSSQFSVMQVENHNKKTLENADGGGGGLADGDEGGQTGRTRHSGTRKKPKSTGAKGYKWGMEQDDKDDDAQLPPPQNAAELALREGVFHIQRRLREVMAPASDGPQLVIVVCDVLAGINDATLGIPWWWVRQNMQALHNACRRRATEATFSAAKGSGVQTTVVISVPMRMVPPYYYLIAGTLAQTRRVSKRNLDPSGLCEFWFRSPRRKLNLHHVVNVMYHAALNSSYPDTMLLDQFVAQQPSLATVGEGGGGGVAQGSGGVVDANATMGGKRSSSIKRKRSRDERRGRHVAVAINTSTRPCVERSLTASRGGAEGQSFAKGTSFHHRRRVCYFQRDIAPIDRLFVFPDKLVASALWKAALNMWSDCIHPSPTGYERIGEKLASWLQEDVRNVVMGYAGRLPLL